MGEGFSWVLFIFWCYSVIMFVCGPLSDAQQLAPSESRILLQIQQLLEYPPSLQSWNTWTDFCSLPSTPSFAISCSGNHVVELSIVGNKTSPSRIHGPNFTVSEQSLSARFSLDSFITVLTKLWNLERLSLVSLGLWGPLPGKISRFKTLEVLNLTSNFIYGEIPLSLSTFPRLRSLVLSDNLFNGSVPDLRDLVLLLELDLSNNGLGPEFPSVADSLVRVSLGNNSIRSEIPQSFKEMNDLQVLDVSSNKLIGPIPAFLFSLPSIQYMNLGSNELNGELDGNLSCNVNLSYVDLSNNFLIGKLPSCLESNEGNRKVITLWNCLGNSTSRYQKSFVLCQKDAIAVQPPPKRSQKTQTTMKLGVVIGILCGILVALVLVGILILVLVKKYVWKREGEQKPESLRMEKSPAPISLLGRYAHQPLRTSSTLPPYNVFTLEEMEDATNNFDTSNLLQEVPQGQIFKGWLGNGSVVLVKCLKLKQKHSPRALNQHMEVISKLRHRHLVSVLGHCIVTYHDHPNTGSTVLIVLEYVTNGSLKDHLTDWRKREFLKWPQRMAITLSVARGIQYLHSGGIVGNDLKLDSILLDETLTPKISNYNISLPSTVGAESPLNRPETSNPQQYPEKEDIYQLGVILAETITGKPTTAQHEVDDLHFQLQRGIADSISGLRDLIDPSMRGTFAYDSLKTVAQIAVDCLRKDPAARPTVEDVLWHMQYSVQVQEGWTSSGNLREHLSGNLSESFSNKM